MTDSMMNSNKEILNMHTTLKTTLSRLVFVLCLSVCCISFAQTEKVNVIESPDVIPATGGHGKAITLNNFDDVEKIAYEVQEYFLSGNAHSYSSNVWFLPTDGQWNAITRDEDTQPFLVRAVVYTPKNIANFNGTVYVEWQNVSGLIEAAPDWIHGHVEVSRQGAAYVLASVQRMGSISLKSDNLWWLPELPDKTMVVSDPVRYAKLQHPGDAYAFDIFTQLGQAIRDEKLLGELKAERLIAVGESQSAGWLTGYVNGIQSLTNMYDGFLIHSAFGFAEGLNKVTLTKIRDDLVPVILFQTETDVRLSNGRTRQPEREDGLFRLWEVTGTAHYDAYGLNAGTTDIGDGKGEKVALNYLREPIKQAQVEVMKCETGINAGPMHWVFNAALHWINHWVSTGEAPPVAPRYEGEQGLLFTEFLTDEHGNTLGGIRTPFVDVPLATLKGSGNGRGEGAPMISYFCGIFGETQPFSEEKIKALYPSKEIFMQQYTESAFRAVNAGYLLEEDAVLLVKAADALEFW